jgi:predicted Zn-dependent protease
VKRPLRLICLACIAVAFCVALGGCTIEPFSEPIPIPAGYVPGAYPRPVYVPIETATTAPRATSPTVSTAPVPQSQPVVDEKTRDQVLALTQATIIRRFGVDNDPRLNEYLILVGSLVTIDTPKPDVEYSYVLLKTDQPLSCAIAPRTICVSRGLIGQMQDESELAGVLAREISNLLSSRTLKAADLPAFTTSTTQPTTHPASAPTAASPLAYRLSAKLTELLLKPNLTPDLEQAADLEGARFAAAAKYAPDGYLRLLTRLKPETSPAPSTQPTSAWDRIRSLNTNVQIVAKAYPQSTVRLPVRFETYKPAARE